MHFFTHSYVGWFLAFAYTSSATSSHGFDNLNIYTPSADYEKPGVLYPRTVQLQGDVLLATWENYSPEPPQVYFPIFQSKDSGHTWNLLSNVTDKANGWGLRWEPNLYVLPVKIGKFPAGTVLLSGVSSPTDHEHTRIDVYASLDRGQTWEFVSHVAKGGKAKAENGIPAIWEPFLLSYEGKIIVYYSDQRDPKHGQKIVHQVSDDLLTWNDPVDDVAYDDYHARPGMATIAQLPNKHYILTYEYGGGATENSAGYKFPVYYKIAEDPLHFKASEGIPIITDKAVQPNGSPFVTWTSFGGQNGTIIVSSGSHGSLFINQALGDRDQWKEVSTPEKRAYSRSLRVLEDHPNLLLIIGAGLLEGTLNSVTVGVLDWKHGLTEHTD